jgi:hypothetical protein
VAPYIALAAFMAASAAIEPLAMLRCRRSINEWAIVNEVRMESISRRWFSPGPFKWRGARWSRVFALAATDRSGRSLQGFARVGGGYAGVLADEVDVRWT